MDMLTLITLFEFHFNLKFNSVSRLSCPNFGIVIHITGKDFHIIADNPVRDEELIKYLQANKDSILAITVAYERGFSYGCLLTE